MFNFLKRNKNSSSSDQESQNRPVHLPIAMDIHCHVLPDLDDGSPDLATSVELVGRMHSELGLQSIMASPHVTSTTFENDPSTVDPAVESLRAALDKEGIPVRLTNWAEYRIDELLLRHIEQHILMPAPNNYLLVENSFLQEPWNLDQLLFDLKVKGYKPILAHPERYAYYAERHRDRYEAIHMAGTRFQVNLLSLAGHYGKAEKQTAEWLLRHGMVDFLGTDIHRHAHVDSLARWMRTSDYRHLEPALRAAAHNDTAFVTHS